MNQEKELKRTVQNSLDRTVTGQQTTLSGQPKTMRLSKDHADFWLGRIKKRSYHSPSGKILIPEWQVRLFHEKRESWFNLGTNNKAAAASKARDIWRHLQSFGWEPTEAKFKPRQVADQAATIEEFSKLYLEALKRVETRPTPQTSARYIKSLKFVCRRVRVTRIADLTPAKVQKFKGDYLTDGRTQERDEDSLKVSCNAILRNCAALFSRQVLDELQKVGIKLENPFAGQKLRGVRIKEYHPLGREKLDAIWRDSADLRDGDPEAPERKPIRTGGPKAKLPEGQKSKRWKEPNFRNPQTGAYLLLLLELGLGLRRNEADKAQWDWLGTDQKGRHYIEVRATPYFTPKGKKPRTIPVEKVLFDAIQASRNQVSPFIVPGRLPKRYEPGKEPKNLVYRCDPHHRALAHWLRKHGIVDDKPCHLLRKEFGSYVATAFSLFAAQKLLGHSSPKVTNDYYAALTQLPELNHAKVTA